VAGAGRKVKSRARDFAADLKVRTTLRWGKAVLKIRATKLMMKGRKNDEKC